MKKAMMVGATAVLMALCTSCVTEHKAVGAGATVTALRVESSGSVQSGTPLPNIMLGGGAVAYASSPNGQPVHVVAERRSWLGGVLGIEAGDRVEIVIGAAPAGDSGHPLP